MIAFLNNCLYVIGIIMAWPIQWIFFRKKIYYEDKKTTSRFIKGGALIVSNHKSLMDFMMDIFIFPFHKLYCLMSELIYSHGKFVSFWTTMIGGVKVDRGAYDFGFIDKSLDLLARGKLLIVYPEAKIPLNNRMLPFHPSYILIALKSGAPIIPIYNDGHYKFKERSHCVIGKAIQLRDYCTSENPTKEEIEYLNNLVRNKIKELEKICKEGVNKDTYNHGFRFKYFLRDLGRFQDFLLNIHFKIKIHNAGKHKKNLKIKGGGIIVANHQSFSDPLVLMDAFWRRRIYILAAEVVFDGHPFRSFLLRQLGIVRIDRNINDFDAIEKCINIAKAGNLVVVFPGGRIDRDGSLDEFKAGAALLAVSASVPLYPLYIKKRTHKLGRSHIYLGEKIDVESLRTSSHMNTKDLTHISEVLYNTIKNLEGEANGNI